MARKKKFAFNFSSNQLLMAAAALLVLVIVIAQFLPRTSLNVLAGKDSTPPVITFVNPTEGAVIGDGQTRLLNINVSAKIEDENMSNLAYLYVDGELYHRMSGNKYGSDFSTYIYMPNFENGLHTLEIRAEDGRRNTGATTINVEFNNAPKSDFEPPIIEITSPSEGTVYKKRKQYSLHYKVSDNSGRVGRVDVLYVQENKKTKELSEQVACQDYTGRTEGVCYFWTKAGAEVILRARAYDYENNVGEDSVNVIVK